MSVRRRLALLVLFPFLGGLGALAFRPPERCLQDFQPIRRRSLPRLNLPLPNGDALHFIAVPSPEGLPLFWLAETETPARAWRQFRRGAPGGEAAASGMTHEEARAFCEWLSERSGRRARLPRAEEWRLAARAGHASAEFPWGYGTAVPRGTAFRLSRPPPHPGPALGHGYRDLAGGLWEWSERGLLLGGSWAERDPRHLRIDASFRPPEHYAGSDAGFRVLVEIDIPPRSARDTP